MVMEALKHDPEAAELHGARDSEGAGESTFQVVSLPARARIGLVYLSTGWLRLVYCLTCSSIWIGTRRDTHGHVKALALSA